MNVIVATSDAALRDWFSQAAVVHSFTCRQILDGHALVELLCNNGDCHFLLLDEHLPQLELPKLAQVCQTHHAAGGKAPWPYFLLYCAPGQPVATFPIKPYDILLKPINFELLAHKLAWVKFWHTAFTEYWEMQEKFSAAQQVSAMLLMAAGIAQEMVSPLNAVKLRLAALQQQLCTPPVNTGALWAEIVRIFEQFQRMENLMQQLRNMAHSDGVPITTADICTAVANALYALGGALAQQHIVVFVDSPLLPLKVYAHPLQLEQIIMSMLNHTALALADTAVSQPQITVKIVPSPSIVELLCQCNARELAADSPGKVLSKTTRNAGAEPLCLSAKIAQYYVRNWQGSIQTRNTQDGGQALVLTLRRAPNQ